MLTIWAVAMIVSFMLLTMSGRVSPIVALILTPLAFGLLAGSGRELGAMMLKGVEQMAPTGVMLAFAILYFGLMVDAGLFDPLVRLIVRTVDGNPVRIVTCTSVLALAVSLDGNGATTYLICTSALMPLYRRMGLSTMTLACLLVLSVGITHICPWAGPTARVAIALGIDPAAIFLPLIPAMLISAAFVIGLGYLFGRREQRRLTRISAPIIGAKIGEVSNRQSQPLSDEVTKRPKLFLINLVVTVGLLTGLMLNTLPLPILFMIGTAIALPLNYPSLEIQRRRIAAHAPTIFRVLSLTFAAGIFVGVLNGSGMSGDLAKNVVRAIPPPVGPYLAPIADLLSLPFYFFTSNEVYHFGVLPVLAKTAGHYGISPVEMARAAAIGTPVNLLCPFAPSTYLLVSLVGIEFTRLQRFALKWAVLLSLILLAAALLTRVIPLRGPIRGSAAIGQNGPSLIMPSSR